MPSTPSTSKSSAPERAPSNSSTSTGSAGLRRRPLRRRLAADAPRSSPRWPPASPTSPSSTTFATSGSWPCYDDLFEALGLPGDGDRPQLRRHGRRGAGGPLAPASRRTGLAAPLGLWHDDVPAADFFAQPSPMHRDTLFGPTRRAHLCHPSRSMSRHLSPSPGPRCRRRVPVAAARQGPGPSPAPDHGREPRDLGRQRRSGPDRLRRRPLRVGQEGEQAGDEGLGHMAHYRRPDEFAELVGTFLGR